jgi:very-short-patch-repair endonuclease
MKLPSDLQALAEEQHGLVTRAAALRLGCSRRAFDHLRTSGILIEIGPKTSIFRFAGSPPSRNQQVMAAVLDAGLGGCVSHDSATALWRIPGYRVQPVHLWRVRGATDHPNRLGIQHRTRRLPEHHVTRIDGIPVTTPTRTLADQAARLQPGRMARLLDDAWGRRLTDHRRLEQMIDELSASGRTGLNLLRSLVAERGPDYQPPESNLERRLAHLLQRAGLDGFLRQVVAGDAEDVIGRVDFKHEGLPLVLEVQSDLHHALLVDRAADELRTKRLEAAGFTVLEIWEHDIWHHPDRVISRVREGCQRLRAGQAVSADLQPGA